MNPVLFEPSMQIITKTCLYKFDPLKPHFYIVKRGFTGVYIIFHISAQNIDCGYSLEPPRRGGSNEYPQSMFWAEIWKISEFLYLKIFSFWRWNFLYIWIGVFSKCIQCHHFIYIMHGWARPRWLSWMRRPTGDQEDAGSSPVEVGNILSWRLIMKYFLRSFSPFRWFKKGSWQFLAKECAQYWLTA